MANIKPVGNNTKKNLLLAAAIIAAAIAGYFMLTKKSTTTNAGNSIPDGNSTNAGNTTGSGKTPGSTTTTNPGTSSQVPAQCLATAAEFPLKQGSGYSNRPACENTYVKNVQTVLNKFLKHDGLTFLPVDGKFGPNTSNAVIHYYGSPAVISKQLYDSMMTYF